MSDINISKMSISDIFISPIRCRYRIQTFYISMGFHCRHGNYDVLIYP
jgi:hypothetical protein